VVIGIRSANIRRAVVDHPAIPPGLILKVDLDNVTFINDDRLLEMLSRTSASPDREPLSLDWFRAARSPR
jgi:hypothetical protein